MNKNSDEANERLARFLDDSTEITDYAAPVWFWRWLDIVAPTWRREVLYWIALVVFGFLLGRWFA